MIKSILKLILAGVLFCAFSSCQKKEEAPEWKTSRDEMMAIHDSTMLRFSDLTEYQDRIRKKIEPLSEGDSAIVQGRAIIKELADAEEAMLNWMRFYEEPNPADQTTEEIMAYLKEQTDSIRRVDQLTQTSLENAKLFLD